MVAPGVRGRVCQIPRRLTSLLVFGFFLQSACFVFFFPLESSEALKVRFKRRRRRNQDHRKLIRRWGEDAERPWKQTLTCFLRKWLQTLNSSTRKGWRMIYSSQLFTQDRAKVYTPPSHSVVLPNWSLDWKNYILDRYWIFKRPKKAINQTYTI